MMGLPFFVKDISPYAFPNQFFVGLIHHIDKNCTFFIPNYLARSKNPNFLSLTHLVRRRAKIALIFPHEIEMDA